MSNNEHWRTISGQDWIGELLEAQQAAQRVLDDMVRPDGAGLTEVQIAYLEGELAALRLVLETRGAPPQD